MPDLFDSLALDAGTNGDDAIADSIQGEVDAFLNQGTGGDDADLNQQDSQNASPDNSAPRQDAAGVDEKRFEFWQGKHDQERREKEALMQEIQRLQPVLQAIDADPELAAAIEAKLSGRPVQTLQAPVPPTKPDNYNENEAFTNPQSESWKYRKENEKFLQDRIEYMNQRMAEQEEILAAQEQQVATRMQRAQTMQKLNMTLQKQFGFKPEEIPGFIQTMSSPESVSLPFLVQFYRFRQAVAARTRKPNGAAPAADNFAPPPVKGGGQAKTDDSSTFLTEARAHRKLFDTK